MFCKIQRRDASTVVCIVVLRACFLFGSKGVNIRGNLQIHFIFGTCTAEPLLWGLSG